jgi:biotin-dependent carboxylase-like uncharacterized protein
MTQAKLRVMQAGPHVSLQDAGRRGVMRFGVPASGPMDRTAFAIANAALGNSAGATTIEVSVAGLGLQCRQGSVSVAIAGGGFLVDVDGLRQPSWSVLTLQAGQSLRLQAGAWGSWAYLAFAGTLESKAWLGSTATHAASGFGGGKLAAEMDLVVSVARVLENTGPLPCPVFARPRQELHCVLGPQERFFSPETIATFTQSIYQLSDAYDRMGVRLNGPRIVPEHALSIPSEAILRGSVQVPGDGIPTVLLADHQTTGGYPKIATVIDCDLDGFVQCRPRDQVRFRYLTAEKAVQIARLRARITGAFLETLRQRQGL